MKGSRWRCIAPGLSNDEFNIITYKHVAFATVKTSQRLTIRFFRHTAKRMYIYLQHCLRLIARCHQYHQCQITIKVERKSIVWRLVKQLLDVVLFDKCIHINVMYCIYVPKILCITNATGVSNSLLESPSAINFHLLPFIIYTWIHFKGVCHFSIFLFYLSQDKKLLLSPASIRKVQRSM